LLPTSSDTDKYPFQSGWAGLSNILITPTTEGGFGLSPPVTLQIFSVSSSFACLSQLFLGIIQDKYNPKVCSIISNIIVALGCFVFVASVRSRFLIYSGAILIGVGGPGVQLSLLHLGNLFPGRENTVMSLINGTINLSFIVFPLLTSIWVDGNVSFQSLFQFLGGSILILVLISFWVWQDTTYEKNPGISCAEIKNNSDDEISLSEIQPERDGIDSNMTATSTLEDLSFREQMHSGRVIRLAIFFVVTSFWANYYIASISTEVRSE
jgi:MFS family permease